MSELTSLAIGLPYLDTTQRGILAKNQARFSREKSRLQETYGDLCESELKRALKLEDEDAPCRDCTGLPCKKKVNKHIKLFSIEIDDDGYIYPRTGTCEFRRKELIQRGLDRKLKSSRIPQRYFGKTFDDYEVDESNAEAVNWAKSAIETKRGAFLYGKRGTGKTFLASLVAQEFLNAGYSTIFIKVPALLTEVRDTFNGKGERTEAEIMREVYNVDCLVLDDFGMEKPTKFAGTTLCQVIDARYDRNLPTVITSNYPLERIERELNNATDGESYNGSRIVDRLAEFCKPILLKGTSRRN